MDACFVTSCGHSVEIVRNVAVVVFIHFLRVSVVRVRGCIAASCTEVMRGRLVSIGALVHEFVSWHFSLVPWVQVGAMIGWCFMILRYMPLRLIVRVARDAVGCRVRSMILVCMSIVVVTMAVVVVRNLILGAILS